MARTNRFCEGNVIGYDGMIGIIKKNDTTDFHCWEVEFKDCTRILHYRDMVYLCESQSVYNAGLNG